MAKGSKRNTSDIAMVSTGLKGGGGSSVGSENECPLSFRVEVKLEFRRMTGMHVSARVQESEVIIICGQEEVASISGRRGERIAHCLKDENYKYAGTIVQDNGKLYAELQVA